MDLPYLTHDFPGIGGALKQRPEDFLVQEIPLYEPSGQGEHVFFQIQKTGIGTFEAVDRIARAMDLPIRDIGYAGMKDAQAVSEQIFSIWGVPLEMVRNIQVPGVIVQWAEPHGNKLRLGHLSGNRFVIKIRNVPPTDVVRLQPILQRLEAQGMPNYFGEQRFGRRGENHLLGAALVRGDMAAVLKQLLGTPNPAIDDPESLRARKAYDDGDTALAMKLLPRRSGLERRVLSRFINTRRPAAALQVIDEPLKRLWISALQSDLFNAVLAGRIETLDQVLAGDLAYKHDSGGVFRVEDLAREQPRAAAFEISATGPLVGYRMSLPTGEPLRIEQEAMALKHLQPDEFRVAGRLKVKGARRPLRVKPLNTDLSAGVDEHGPYITVTFSLPPGSFATMLLRELMKQELHVESDDETEPDTLETGAPGGPTREEYSDETHSG